jgi:TolB-like protein
LNHTNICTIYEIDEHGDQLFIAMELIDGENLKAKIGQGSMGLDEAVELAIQIAEGLQEAHERGIVHRDIKPGNIMLTPKGQVKIMDFGLAKSLGRAQLTRTGTTVGTVAYMSPEQGRGDPVDHRTDIWSLGVSLYEMVTGQLPFTGEYEPAVVYSILNEEPEPLNGLRTGVPLELERVVAKAMAKNPGERYERVDEVLADLKSARRGLDGTVTANQISETKPSPSIAILPFVNMSKDPENEYFSDGVTEDIITALMKVEGLRVAARSSAFQFKGKVPDVMQVGRKLRVGAVLEGGVRQAGGRLRITAQLINVTDGFQMWSERYDQPMEDIFDIQDKISQKIVEALKVKLVRIPGQLLVKHQTADPEAYDHYLRGRHHWNKRNLVGYAKAVEHFEQASEKDLEFALPYVGLADCFLASAWYGSMNPQEAITRIKPLLDKALQIDEELAEAHASMGFLQGAFLWNWARAEAAFQRSFELNPNYAAARFWYVCHSLGPRGRFEDGTREAERAQNLEPLIPIYYGGATLLLLWQRQYDQALVLVQKGLELEPDLAPGLCLLAWIQCEEGRYEEAVATAERASRFLPPGGLWGPGILGFCYARWGKKDEARRLLTSLEGLRRQSYAQEVALAAIHAGLDEKDMAIEWLDRAFEAHCGYLGWLRYEPMWDSLRVAQTEPRIACGSR